MSYSLSILKDNPLGFWKLDEASGNIAYDYSGCGNNAQYYNFSNETIFPLVSGTASGTTITDLSYIEFPITKNYYGQDASDSFGTEKTSDNDFSLELWVYPKQITTVTQLLATSGGIGVYWDNGNITFSVAAESVDYTLPNISKTIHIVAVYRKQSISLYIDGVLARSKKINNFKFSNSDILLSAGPCASGDSFIIDSPAVYRYALSELQIKKHFEKNITVDPSQIASLNSGTIFKATEKHQSEADKFMLPLSKSWDYVINDDLAYDEIKNSIYLKPGKTSGEFVEAISLSIRKLYVSSKIEWLGGEGVKVYASTDELTWTECINGSAVPNTNNKKNIYIKAEFNSTDSEIFTPELYYLSVYFYPEKILYAHNGSGYISTNQTGADIDISTFEHPVLARSKNDGISCRSGGFKLNTLDPIRDLELIFSPKSLSQGYLMYNNTTGAEYSLSWASGGLISKSGISSLYINGQDASSATNISSYLNIGDSNYIYIKFNSQLSGDIWFNAKYSSGSWSGILDDNTYKNITVYPNNNASPAYNYQLYLGYNSLEVQDSDITLTESSISTYSPDWITVSNA